MIIACPCGKKKFEVNASLIPNEGKLLQCGSCSQKWFFKKEVKKEVKKLIDKTIEKVHENVPNNTEKIINLFYVSLFMILSLLAKVQIIFLFMFMFFFSYFI